MKKKLIINAILIGLTLCFTNCQRTVKHQWEPENGYIVDSESAIKLAEIVWTNMYGSKVNDNKPFRAALKNKSIWVVVGTLSSNTKDGVPYIEIRKSDGKILKVTYRK